MKSNRRKIALRILLAIFILGQFIRPQKNNGDLVGEHHVSLMYPIPSDVEEILVRSCYDCHSNHTNYPWYAEIFPVSWYLNSHIVEGKKHLNLSEYTTYDASKRHHKMEEFVEMVFEKEMPLFSYTLVHQNAKLSLSDQEKLLNWAKPQSGNKLIPKKEDD